MDTWLVGDPVRGVSWQLPLGEVPTDISGRLLLTTTFDNDRKASTLRLYDLDTGAVVLTHEDDAAINRSSFLGDSVIFAPAPDDSGVWAISRDSGQPVQIARPSREQPDPRFGRTWQVGSPTHRTVLSQLALSDGGHVVDLVTADGARSMRLPEGSSVIALSDELLVAQTEDELLGLTPAAAAVAWSLPYGGTLQGAYVTSDGARVIVVRFNPDGSGEQQLLVVEAASGSWRVVASWPEGTEPIFWESLSSDGTALFSRVPPEAWATGVEAVDVTVVDLDDGSTRTVSEAPLPAQPIR
jgi:hypothetical protein